MITAQQLHILQHSLGLDQYGQGEAYRNHYVSDPNPDLIALEKLGYLHDRGPQSMMRGNHLYQVTPAGKQCIYRESPKPPKISKGRRKYLAFLRADSGMKFGEWLKTKWAKEVL